MVLLILLLLTTTTFAYSPPIGIPDPGFGIDNTKPVAPVNWSTETAGYYYVNYQMGTDAGRTYGTPSAPKRTIPNPIPAGSYIELHGEYAQVAAGITNIVANGDGGPWIANVSGPAWIVGKSNDLPYFIYKTVVRGSHLYIDSVQFKNGGRLNIGSGTAGYAANNIVVRNCEFVGTTANGGAVVTSNLDYRVSKVIFYNNYLHDFGDLSSTFDEDFCPFIVSGFNTDSVWILSNLMHTASGSGMRSGNGPEDNPMLCRYIYVGSNIVYNVRQAGLAVKTAADVIYSQNVCHDIINTDWSPSKGIGCQYQPLRFWMLFNTVYNVRYGLLINSTNTGAECPIYMIGNVIYNAHNFVEPYGGGCYTEAGIHAHGGSQLRIINNTIYGCVSGITIATPRPITVENNILSNITNEMGYFLCASSTASPFELSYRNNILNNRSIIVPYARIGNDEYSSISTLSSSTGYGGNCFDFNPSFVDESEGNFHLNLSSLAIDSGLTPEELDYNAYDTFYSWYGVSIKYDKDGRLRSDWAVGAYDYNSEEIDITYVNKPFFELVKRYDNKVILRSKSTKKMDFRFYKKNSGIFDSLINVSKNHTDTLTISGGQDTIICIGTTRRD